MATEVFAEEIEEFLEALETVTSARVVANEDGRIEHIYLTTESERDDAAIRRAVTAGLMSRFGLHVEGYRLHVAHLAPPVGRIPRFRVFRIEETIAEDGTKVIVDLRYERDGAQRTTVGLAQSPAGIPRLRTVARAAVDAVRPVLERHGWKVALEAVNVFPFAGVPVALVALSMTHTAGSAQVRIGAEAVRASETEAVVRAALRAVADGMEEEEQPPADRMRRMQVLRDRYHHLVTVSPPLVPPEGGAPPAALAPGLPPAGAEPAPEESGREGGGADVADVIRGVEEIRPEIEGGAAMSTREEPARAEPSTRPAPRGSLEDDFYRRLVQSGTRVHIRCRDGYEIPEAVLKDFGTYSLLVDSRGVEELVYKHGIISIRPHAAVPREVPVQA